MLALLLTVLISLEGLPEAGATVVLALLLTALSFLDGLTGAGSGWKSESSSSSSTSSKVGSGLTSESLSSTSSLFRPFSVSSSTGSNEGLLLVADSTVAEILSVVGAGGSSSLSLSSSLDLFETFETWDLGGVAVCEASRTGGQRRFHQCKLAQ